MKGRQELALLLVLALIGAGLFGYFVTSSPTATVQLDQTQTQATDTAERFLENHGYEVSTYRSSTIFEAREESSTFIQRRLSGSQEIAALEANNVYYWETRFFRPLEQETFRVAVDSRTGEVVRFQHQVPDEAPGGALPAEAARAQAESFLADLGHDLANYELVSSARTERANRVDHTFVWEHSDRRVADAPYRIEVEIHGERIGGYDPHIKVPDGFSHQYQIQQNRGQLLSFGFLGLTALLVVIGIVFGLRYYKAEAFDVRFGLAIGGAVFLLTAVSGFNSIPSLLHNLPTTMAPWQFIMISLGGVGLVGLLMGGVSTLMAGAGKQLSADVLNYDAVSRIQTLRNDASRRAQVRNQLLIGVMIAGIVLGLYAIVYLVGTRFLGFWLPAEPPQVQAVSVYIPALAALFVGGIAALWEEVTFRLFAIPLAKRYLKYTAVAIAVPAIVWGIGHSGYAVLPFWARAVEVSIIGLVLGVAFLRYGIVSTIAAHFTLNAFVTALPMLMSGTGWLVGHGIVALVISLLPMIAAGVLYWYDR